MFGISLTELNSYWTFIKVVCAVKPWATAKMTVHLSQLWQAHKRQPLVLWVRVGSLRTAMLDSDSITCTPSQMAGGIMHWCGTVLQWYLISTSLSHAHTIPLLHHQLDPFVWPIVILSQSCVSFTAWLLSNINAPAPPPPAPALVVAPQCYK